MYSCSYIIPIDVTAVAFVNEILRGLVVSLSQIQSVLNSEWFFSQTRCQTRREGSVRLVINERIGRFLPPNCIGTKASLTDLGRI